MLLTKYHLNCEQIVKFVADASGKYTFTSESEIDVDWLCDSNGNVAEFEYDEETNTTTSSTNLYIQNSNLLVYNLANKISLEKWGTDKDGNAVLVKEKVTPNAENLQQDDKITIV